jgi:hypothetical protein
MSRHFIASLLVATTTVFLIAACDDSGIADTSSDSEATSQEAQTARQGGAPNKTFRIANLKQLEKLANRNPGGTFIQIKDLKGKQIGPIGSASNPFTGTYDGNGHQISGLTIQRSGGSNVGLFAATNGAVLKDIVLKNADVLGQSTVGALVGNNRGTIKDSKVTGIVTAKGTGGDIGGLVGRNNGTITGSTSKATVNGDTTTKSGGFGSSDVGGLVGFNTQTATIESSSATGDVQGRIEIGGLVGTNEGTIRESSATGDAESSEFTVGGLVGVNTGTIDASFAEGLARSGKKGTVGGLVGINSTLGPGQITNAYATGTVQGPSVVGGLVGDNQSGAQINTSFATGPVQSSGLVGGFAAKSDGAINGSYWDTNSTTLSTGIGSGQGGVTGLTTSQMQGSSAATNMSALNFTTIWETVTGDYPALR